MRRMHYLLGVLGLGLCLCAAPLGCSDEVCEEAEAKLRTCLEALDCNRADPADRTRCVTAKSQGEDALSRMSGAPCVSDISDLAEQINRCNPDPGDFCDCF